MGRLKNTYHEVFAQQVVRNKSLSDAYRTMLPDAQDLTPRKVQSRASKLRKRRDISARIDELLQKMEDETIATRDEVAGALSRMVLARPSDLLDDRGQVDMAKIKKAGPELSGVEIETSYGAMGTTTRVKVKHRDAVAAAALLSKIMGWEAPQRVQVENVSLVALKDLRSETEVQ